MKIGFITSCAEKLSTYFPTPAEPTFIPTEPPFTPDDQLAVNIFRENGFQVKPIIWGCKISDLNDFDLVIVRSPWDYMDSDNHKSQFLHWMLQLEEHQIPVANPVALMQWLLDKHYLQDLANDGIDVIPTQYLEKNSTFNLLEYFNTHGQFILKPTISAAGMGLFHIKNITDALHHQSEINKRLEHQAYMLQEFIPEIKTHGEWSLVFLGGNYSHCVHKKPAAHSILVHGEQGGSITFSLTPSDDVIAFAEKVYASVIPAFKKKGGSCDATLFLYLRIDVIETQNGPVLIECEGVEPELFFRAKKDSEYALLQAVKRIS